MERTLQGDEEGVEDGADTDGGQQHRQEVLTARLDGSIVWLETFAKIFQIAVNHHNRIIYNHSQHHDQSRQRHDVQFDAHHIHHRHTHKGAQRDGDGCHDGRTDGEQHHHHQNNNQHRYQQVAQKIADTHCYHFGLVGDAGHLHILWHFVLEEVA